MNSRRNINKRRDIPEGDSIEGIVTKASKNFGFVTTVEDDKEKEYFVPGRCFCGALVGDKVLIREKKSLGQSPEAIITKVLKRGPAQLIGHLELGDAGFVFIPDELGIPVHLTKESVDGSKPGDKVLVKITNKPQSHFGLKGRVVANFGSSEKAQASEKAILIENGISESFSNEVMEEARKIASYEIDLADLNARVDLREELIFTIDGSTTKDIDDAVSLEKTATGYELGVHIADVSHFVKQNGAVDKEARNRGNSLYFANKVMPMLPKELSNGICSLNPNEDRLAFSVFIKLDKSGKIKSFKFKKSIIRSRLQGVYSEINDILENKASAEILEKYADVKENLFLMDELSNKRIDLELARGGFEIHSPEGYLQFDGDKVVDIKIREQGRSEKIIEQFMLTANEAAATFAGKKEIPFLYRVHENPPDSKIADLTGVLGALEVDYKLPGEKLTQTDIKDILEIAKQTPYYEIINYRILRTMAKARYEENPIGHFGLVLENYTHFTSPIRRYSDLFIHRIMTEVMIGKNKKTGWEKKTQSLATEIGKHVSHREIESLSVERSIDDCYKAEFMNKFLGEEFKARITGFNNAGMFIELPNTVDGFIPFSSFPDGRFEVIDFIRARSKNVAFTLGDLLDVILAKSEVSSGKIDFVLAENYQYYKDELRNTDRKAENKKEINRKTRRAENEKMASKDKTKTGKPGGYKKTEDKKASSGAVRSRKKPGAPRDKKRSQNTNKGKRR